MMTVVGIQYRCSSTLNENDVECSNEHVDIDDTMRKMTI